MRFIKVLKKALGETYGKVTKEQLQSLKQTKDAQLIHLKRINNFRPDELSDKDKEELEALNTLLPTLTVLADHATQTPQTIYALLQSIELPNEMYQVELIVDCLLQGLKYEGNSLALFVHLDIDANNPIVFASALLTLLAKGVKAKKILESGLLHRFFERHYSMDPDIPDVYRILNSSDLKKAYFADELQQLLTFASTYRASSREEFCLFALDGSRPNQLKNIRIRLPQFLIFKHPKNLSRLYHVFDLDFLMLILAKQIKHNDDIYVDWLVEILKKLPFDVWVSLFKFIHQQMDLPSQLKHLSELGALTDVNLLEPLLKLNDVDISWMVLFAQPNILQTPERHHDFMQALLERPLAWSNFTFAFELKNNPYFTPYLTAIHQNLFECMLSHANLIDESFDEQIEDIATFELIPTWCENKIAEMKQALIAVIQNNTSCVKASYEAALDEYRKQTAIYQILKWLTPRFLEYPENDYEFQAFIFKAWFTQNPEMDLVEHVQDIHPSEEEFCQYGYEASELNVAKLRTYLQILADVDDEAIFVKVTDILAQSYDLNSINHWINQKLSNGDFLYKRALLMGNKTTLSHWLSRDVEAREVALFSINVQIFLRHWQHLLEYVATHRKALKVMLELYSQDTIQKFMEDPSIVIPLMDKISLHPECLEMIFFALPLSYRLTWLVTSVNSKKENSLFLLSHSPAILKRILLSMRQFPILPLFKSKVVSTIPYIHYLAEECAETFHELFSDLDEVICHETLGIRNGVGKPLAHVLVHTHPKLLIQRLLDFPEFKLMQALSLAGRNLPPLLHYLLTSQPNLLDEFWSKLEKKTSRLLLEISCSNLNILDYYLVVDRPELIPKILNYFSSEECLEILHTHNPCLIESLSSLQNPTILESVLSILPGQFYIDWFYLKIYSGVNQQALDLSNQLPEDIHILDVLELLSSVPKGVRKLDLSDNELSQKIAAYGLPKPLESYLPKHVQSLALENHQFKPVLHATKTRSTSTSLINANGFFALRPSCRLKRWNSTSDIPKEPPCFVIE